jgi:hypothetical protein
VWIIVMEIQINNFKDVLLTKLAKSEVNPGAVAA